MPSQTYPAYFITFEGGDGSGKTTLIEKLKLEFKQKAIPTLFTREPGGTPLADEIRALLLKPGFDVHPMTELLLYEASRAEHVERKIRPALLSKTTVVCDRFTHSSVAFQGYARNLGADLVKKLNSIATAGLEPDLVVWLKVTPEIALQRMDKRGEKSRLDAEGKAFHEMIYRAYLSLEKEALENKPHSWISLDASKSPDELFQELVSHAHWKRLWK